MVVPLVLRRRVELCQSRKRRWSVGAWLVGLGEAVFASEALTREALKRQYFFGELCHCEG